jgi:branched-chain amino acid transport system ATP-binding protein
VKELFKVIERINKMGVTILIVEQNVRLALEVASRGYVLENGRVVGHGEAKTLLGDPRLKEAYLG